MRSKKTANQGSQITYNLEKLIENRNPARCFRAQDEAHHFASEVEAEWAEIKFRATPWAVPVEPEPPKEAEREIESSSSDNSDIDPEKLFQRRSKRKRQHAEPSRRTKSRVENQRKSASAADPTIHTKQTTTNHKQGQIRQQTR